MHEASRVYKDKFIDDADIKKLDKLKFDIAKQTFEVCTSYILLHVYMYIPMTLQDLAEEEIKSKPLIYCHFANGVGEPKYMSVSSWTSLNKILVEALDSYNEINAIMNLVLFEDAMQHM